MTRRMGAGFGLLVLAPLSLPAQTPLTTQRLYDTIPNLPEHYERRIAEFAAQPLATGQVVFLGNSITEGGNWAELLGDTSVVNRGISGDITHGVLKRLDDITRLQPAKLFILIGINDIGKDIPVAVIADNYRRIIEQVQAGSPGTAIYVQSVLPVDPEYPGFPQHYDKEKYVRDLNGRLLDLAAATQTTFVDLTPAFIDARHRLDPRYSTDGLHLSPAGYQVWVERLRQTGSLELGSDGSRIDRLLDARLRGHDDENSPFLRDRPRYAAATPG